MALTIDNVSKKAGRAGQATFVTYLEIDLDSAYPQAEGGYDLGSALDVKDVLPGNTVLFVYIQQTATYTFRWNQSTGRFTVHATADGAEAADDANLAAVTGLQATIFSQ